MFQRIKERTLPTLIGLALHPIERLTPKEKRVLQECLTEIPPTLVKRTQPVVIAMVGLVGSGKSTVAKILAQKLDATVIEADAIRVKLRKQKERFEHVRLIAELLLITLIERGQNVILDSDFIDDKKRASLRRRLYPKKARLEFVRVICDFDVATGRIISTEFKNHPDDFFGSADSAWRQSNSGSVVKLREMMRRLPHHYAWYADHGGRWVPRTLPFDVHTTVNTSDQDAMLGTVLSCARSLAKR